MLSIFLTAPPLSSWLLAAFTGSSVYLYQDPARILPDREWLSKVVVQANTIAVSTAGAKPRFAWPVRGRISGAFASKADGRLNDGIDIPLPEGTPIRAAEAGVVIYAGNELKGYGNLVLIRHAADYVTAYAHASELNVQRGQKVQRGQTIAKSGQTGNVSEPMLHFEVRKGSQPIDPVTVLEDNPDERTKPKLPPDASAARIKGVQRFLFDFGYGSVRPSGVFDDATRTAIFKFQKERKLPIDGAITDRLLQEMSAIAGRALE